MDCLSENGGITRNNIKQLKTCRERDNFREIIKYFRPDAVNYSDEAFFNVSASIADEKIDPMFWQVGSVENNEELIKYRQGIAKRKAIIASDRV